MTEPKLINPQWDQGWRRRTSLSMMYASPEVKAPLVMTLGGYPDAPTILEMVDDDGTTRRFDIVDHDRMERLMRCVDILIALVELGPDGNIWRLANEAKQALHPGDTILP